MIETVANEHEDIGRFARLPAQFVVTPLAVLFFGYGMLPYISFQTAPAADFLDRELYTPNISSFDRTGITVRELQDFYRSGPLSITWERVDRNRFILHASGQDALTRQPTVIAWQLVSIDSEREVPTSQATMGGKVVYVERLALNGEIAPVQVISMATLAITYQIGQTRASGKK